MGALRDEHKRLIVQRLACFVSSKEIQAELSESGVAVTLSRIAYYDPSLPSAGASASWRLLHAETRAQFVRDTASIAIANKSYRLSRLDAMARASEAKKNYPLAAQLHEQAAKEMGEAYTNKRVIEAADPAAALAALLGMSKDDVTAAVAGVGASAP